MQQWPEKNEFSLVGYKENGSGCFCFYRISGQSFEWLKWLMFWGNEKDIGETTVDLWGTNPGVETKVWQCN
jgi:hypothetical protein